MARKTSFAGFSPKRRRRAAHIVAVVAFDGVVLADLATPCELFGRVRGMDGRAAYEVRVCSIAPEVRSEHVTLQVPWRLSSLKRAGTVIIPGIDDLDRAVPAALLRAIRRAVGRRTRVASICSGAFVLAAAGALDGLRATTHWRTAPELARRHPQIDVDADVLYVDNGQVLTSAGAAAGFDLCLHSVGTLLTWLERNVHEDLSLSVIARRAGMSTRTLSRRFRQQVGTTPALWVSRARIRRAQRLLETTDLSVESIAAGAGFRSSAVLREHFGRTVGTSPQAYRRSFRAA